MSLLSNAKWNAFTQFSKIGIQGVNLVYLATIIPPAEYGLMAMATVVLNLGLLLRDLGTSAALIQRKTLNESLKNTVFWLNTFVGCLLALIVCGLAPWIAAVYHQEKLTLVLSVMSIIFPLSSCAAAHLALMERESRFKKISLIEVSSSLVSVLVAIIMANFGWGVFSLVVQAVVMNLMSAIQFWLASDWRPSLKKMINFAELKSIFGFSANLSLFNLINYFSRNVDSFMIGKYMSAAILGSYNLAYRIMIFPLQSLTYVASRSLYPILSRSQDDLPVLREIYLNCVFVILVITAPLMSGIAIFSHPFINLVFGEQWHITAAVLTWLAPTAIVQSVLSTAGPVFSARGRTDILMRLGIVGTGLQVGAFFIGIHYSITQFAMCYLIANIINFFPIMTCLLRLIGSDLTAFSRKILPVFAATLGMLLFYLLVNVLVIPLDSIDSYSWLVTAVIPGMVVYGGLLILFSVQFRAVVLARLGR